MTFSFFHLSYKNLQLNYICTYIVWGKKLHLAAKNSLKSSANKKINSQFYKQIFTSNISGNYSY